MEQQHEGNKYKNFKKLNENGLDGSSSKKKTD